MKNIEIKEIKKFSGIIKKIPYKKAKNSKGNIFFPLDLTIENGNLIMIEKRNSSAIKPTAGVVIRENEDGNKVNLAYANLLYSPEFSMKDYALITGCSEQIIGKISEYNCYLVPDEYLLAEFEF